MPAFFRHFAINAEDVQRAKSFYETIFNWTFHAWGPPNFYQVRDAGSGVLGALQERRALVRGQPANTFEPTFGVDDIDATIAKVVAAGGKVVLPRTRIEGVGDLAYFQDSEGNLVGAMQYDVGVWA